MGLIGSVRICFAPFNIFYFPALNYLLAQIKLFSIYNFQQPYHQNQKKMNFIQKIQPKMQAIQSTDLETSCVESSPQNWLRNNRQKNFQYYNHKNFSTKVSQLKLKLNNLQANQQKMTTHMDQCVKLLQSELQKRGNINEQLKVMIASIKKQIKVINKDMLKLGQYLQVSKNMEKMKLPAWRLSLNIQKHDDYQIHKQLMSRQQKNNFSKALRKTYGQSGNTKMNPSNDKKFNFQLLLLPESLQQSQEKQKPKSKVKTKLNLQYGKSSNSASKKLRKSISSREVNKH